MARKRFLLLDSRIIEKVVGGRLFPGEVTKHPANPLFGEDRPWEPYFANLYPNVIYDAEDRLYKCWYNPMIVEERTTSVPVAERNPYNHPDYMAITPNGREMGVCYATSVDGIIWNKPDLGLIEFGGDSLNNLVRRGPDGVGVIKDPLDMDPERRYKMFLCGPDKMQVSFSRDGLHWGRPLDIPEVDAHGTHPNAFWAPDLARYVGITREFAGGNGARQVCRTESPDFIHWSADPVVFEGPHTRSQAHDMIVFPAAGIYIGLLGMMDFPQDPKVSNMGVTQHVELAWSPDSVTWHRIAEGTPFIGHTSADEQRYGTMPYDWGTIFPSAPIFLDNEVRIYYGAGDWFFFDWRKGYLALATIRPDRWAGYEPLSAQSTAEITTSQFEFDGQNIAITADVGEGGSVLVSVLNKEGGEPAIAEPVYATVTDGQTIWVEKRGLKAFSGRPIRLRFQLRKAKLYSFSIQ